MDEGPRVRYAEAFMEAITEENLDEYARHLAGVLFMIVHKQDREFIHPHVRLKDHATLRREYGIELDCCGEPVETPDLRGLLQRTLRKNRMSSI